MKVVWRYPHNLPRGNPKTDPYATLDRHSLLLISRLNSEPGNTFEALLSRLLLVRRNSLFRIGIIEATTRLARLELCTNGRTDSSSFVLIGATFRRTVGIAYTRARNKLAALSVADVGAPMARVETATMWRISGSFRYLLDTDENVQSRAAATAMRTILEAK